VDNGEINHIREKNLIALVEIGSNLDMLNLTKREGCDQRTPTIKRPAKITVIVKNL